jgi:hypothetical protein
MAGEELRDLGERRVLPHVLDLVQPQEHEHERPRALSDHPVGEMQAVGARVADLRRPHAAHPAADGRPDE